MDSVLVKDSSEMSSCVSGDVSSCLINPICCFEASSSQRNIALKKEIFRFISLWKWGLSFDWKHPLEKKKMDTVCMDEDEQKKTLNAQW